MPNIVDITLRGNDETAAAFASAESRLNKYGRTSAKTGADLNDMRRSMLGAGAASQSLAMLLQGNVGALDNIGTSLGMVNPKLIKFGSILAAIGIGAQLGKMLGEIEAIDEVLGRIETRARSSMRLLPEQTTSQIKDLDAAARNAKELSAARADVAGARASAMPAGPDKQRAAAEQENRRALEKIEEEISDAQNKVMQARASLAAVKVKAGNAVGPEEQKEITRAEGDLRRAEKDAAATEEQAILKREAATLRLAAAVREVTDELVNMQDKAEGIELQQGMQFDESQIKNAQGYIDRITNALGALDDKRLKGLARNAMGGADKTDENKALVDKQAELAIVDQMTARRKARSDPAVRAQADEIERERRRTENQMKRIEERRDKGRPLATWEKELLKEQEGIQTRATEEQIKKKAEESLRVKQQEARDESAKNTADELKLIREKIDTVLQAR